MFIIGIDIVLRKLFYRFKKRESVIQWLVYLFLLGLLLVGVLWFESKFMGIILPINISFNWLGVLQAILIILSIAAILFAVMSIEIYVRKKRNTPLPAMEFSKPEDEMFKGSQKYIGAFIISACAGIFEELIFRYYVLGRLEYVTDSTLFAVVVSSLLFGFIHILDGGWKSVISTGLFGIFFSVVYVLTGNLLVVIIIHAIWNFLSFTIPFEKMINFINRLLN
ncbi:CPBP family intramembrane metalloprotease [Bacillus luteolus]|uniref:CPBP family intramembrane metalloprotease n=2 Tax=Litchfieldia luteola TaxID=682179 RepID=A0ABR9QMU2_9BACI|nr:CPBP family intramembrane glutamic endopeptidase [Cytobacillus luteolus]MBE4909812.1 CPBP family intramembrane metalloprotease [Cytobacillus luteolus]MBP1942639.1 membrane protease YdiL (CAAX protease family) [Cytobacillus luteolus]